MYVTSQLSVSWYFVSSLHRTVAPIFGGGLYSVSLTEKARAIGFPFDYNLIFIIFSVVYFAVLFMTACTPTSLDHQMYVVDYVVIRVQCVILRLFNFPLKRPVLYNSGLKLINHLISCICLGASTKWNVKREGERLEYLHVFMFLFVLCCHTGSDQMRLRFDRFESFERLIQNS